MKLTKEETDNMFIEYAQFYGHFVKGSPHFSLDAEQFNKAAQELQGLMYEKLPSIEGYAGFSKGRTKQAVINALRLYKQHLKGEQ